MTGKPDLAVQKMNNVLTILDEYEKQTGLPTLQSPGTEDELQQYLLMDRNTIEKLDIAQCGDIAYRLKQYAFYIQRTHNRERSRFSWAANQLNAEVASRIHNYDRFLKYSTKVALVAKNDHYVNDLYKIYVYAKQRMERLTFLSNAIKDLGDTLLNIQRIKLGIMKEH